MDMAKPGLIKSHCYPNAMFSFGEYLEDFANPRLKEKGFKLIEGMIDEEIETVQLREMINKNLKKVKSGERDIYV